MSVELMYAPPMIFTTKSGIEVQVDDDRADLAELKGWWLHSSGYIVREVPADSTGRRRVVFLHHEVMGTTPDRSFRVDHVNRDVFDNRRENLRITTPSQNAQNRSPITRRGTYRGVTWNKHKKKWVALATVNYKRHEIGRFDDEEEAAAAIAAWRAEHMSHSDADRGAV